MAICAVCGKSTSFGNQVSFAGNRSKRTRKPNLQRVRVLWEGRRARVTVCTRCIKSGKVVKAV